MNPRQIIERIALAALAAKLGCAALTVGTNDVDAFYNFGRFIAERGLIAQYFENPEFNHTPLVGWFCASIYALGKGFAFALLLRLPGILADFWSVRLVLEMRYVLGRPPWWALALFAASPVNFMISGFHGNVDAVLAALLLAAVRAAFRGQALWCGVFFGLACQVKVIALLLAPAFFFFWLAHARGRAFFLPATATILAGWAAPLLFAPTIFISNVLGYSSNWGSWGVTFALQLTGAPAFAPSGFAGHTAAQIAVANALKLATVAGVLILAWRRRAEPAHALPATLALTWAIFFVCAPGVGAQYLVWIAPFLLLAAPRWYAAVTVASAVFLGIFYTTICGGFPWYHGISTAELLPRWVGWSLLPWATLLAFAIAQMVASTRSSAAENATAQKS